MSDSSSSSSSYGYRVETTSRLAQWRIDNFSSCSSYRKSDPFQIGNWNWHLSVEKNRLLFIKLFPQLLLLQNQIIGGGCCSSSSSSSSVGKKNLINQQPPIASFTIRVLSSVGYRKVLVHPGVTDKLLKHQDDFNWAIEIPFTGKLIIDVEFHDLKTTPPTGGEPYSIWSEGLVQGLSHATALVSLSQMLSENIQTDITINASDGSIGAHRAVLAGRSPVFRSMFSHNLKEKELSTVNISDMSIEACQAFLSYIYGSIQHQEFLVHRLALLSAADKYNISDLKEACHDSLVEDIDAKNVLERLQIAYLYELGRLKSSCMMYLIKFGKIFEIQDEFKTFLQSADREIIAEIFHEVMKAWKGF